MEDPDKFKPADSISIPLYARPALHGYVYTDGWHAELHELRLLWARYDSIPNAVESECPTRSYE